MCIRVWEPCPECAYNVVGVVVSRSKVICEGEQDAEGVVEGKLQGT